MNFFFTIPTSNCTIFIYIKTSKYMWYVSSMISMQKKNANIIENCSDLVECFELNFRLSKNYYSDTTNVFVLFF